MMKMKRYWVWLLLLVGLGLVGALWRWQTQPAVDPVTISGITVPPVPTLNADWISQGEVLYGQSCAGCHGSNLEGAPNWKQAQPNGKFLPPPQDSDGHSWHHTDDLLISIITEGGDPEISDMPAFKDDLDQQEMHAVLEFIKSSWGPEEREFQWWVTAKD